MSAIDILSKEAANHEDAALRAATKITELRTEIAQWERSGAQYALVAKGLRADIALLMANLKNKE